MLSHDSIFSSSGALFCLSLGVYCSSKLERLQAREQVKSTCSTCEIDTRLTCEREKRAHENSMRWLVRGICARLNVDSLISGAGVLLAMPTSSAGLACA